jgi:hypothetical protein
VGRPRRYCRRSCRQRDYEARRRASELGLGESELILARHQFDAVADALFVLEAAIEDVEGDLSRSAELADYRAAVTWLLDAAKPLVALGLTRAP